MSDVVLLSGRSNVRLARRIADYLGLELGKCTISEFADGEIIVKIEESIRGSDIFVVQSTCNPSNQNLMELLIMIDAIKRASAERITAVIPYFGYARQDRKAEPRVPITAKLVANLITTAGANRVLTMDLHADQIQGFFDIPVDHLYAFPVFIDYLKDSYESLSDFVVVSPDTGGVKRARYLASFLDLNIAIIDKRRTGYNVAEVMNLVGDVNGKNAVLIDDIIDTGGTISKAAKKLKEEGAKKVIVMATHPVLSSNAKEKLSDDAIDEIVVTDTIPIPEEKMLPKIKVLSVYKLFAEAIARIHTNSSVSSLFVKSSSNL
ncbi:MAG: ribose-phosphate pyrophosphokinase [Brevinematales bacterium]|nr:ribose-phosphate pyrophosphokinase [Brevinematales bacterium]